ncbi:MAG: hypothetical protein EKK41_11160 [Hyphomicrobiales bacterium]|nr:MAG: hypothetical protein EKK41_11160 [Hyphomicrobiales bacterium]
MNEGDFTFELGKIIDRAKERLEQFASEGQRDPATHDQARPAEVTPEPAPKDASAAAPKPEHAEDPAL